MNIIKFNEEKDKIIFKQVKWANLKSKILTSSWGGKINSQMYSQKGAYICLRQF